MRRYNFLLFCECPDEAVVVDPVPVVVDVVVVVAVDVDVVVVVVIASIVPTVSGQA